MVRILMRACLPVALVLAAAVPRLRLAWRAYEEAPYANGDEEQYWTRGRYLERCDGSFSLLFGAPGLEAYRAALYPSFIALTGRLWPPLRAGKVRLAQAALGCAAVALVFWLGCGLHSRLAGAAAAAFLAVNRAQVAYCVSLNVHSFFTFLVLLAACCLARWAARPSARSAAWLGLALGISLCCRSTLIGLAALAAGAAALEGGRPRARLGRAACVLAFCALPLLPWTVRNALRLGEFVPLERGAVAPNFFYAAMGGVTSSAGVGKEYAMAEALEPGLKGAGSDAYRAAMIRLAWRTIRRRPSAYLISCAARARALAVCYRIWFGPAALALAILGALVHLRQAALRAVALVPVYILAAHAPISITERYVLESIPLVCVLSGCGLAFLAERAAAAAGGAPRSARWWLERGALSGGAPAAAGVLAAFVWTAGSAFIAADAWGAAHTEAIGSAETDLCRRLDARGQLAFAAGRRRDALRDFYMAVSAEPRCAQARLDRGVALASFGSHRLALRDYDEAERLLAWEPSAASLMGAVRSSRATSLQRLEARR